MVTRYYKDGKEIEHLDIATVADRGNVTRLYELIPTASQLWVRDLVSSEKYRAKIPTVTLPHNKGIKHTSIRLIMRHAEALKLFKRLQSKIEEKIKDGLFDLDPFAIPTSIVAFYTGESRTSPPQMEG